MYKFLPEQVLMQESLRDSLLFLVNINDLADDLTSNAKSFADDTSLFYFQINRWTFTWKMVFHSDPSNQSHEITFNRKIKKFIILCYVLRTALSRKPQIKNTLEYFLMLFSCCLILLTFEEHLKVITTKANKTIGLLSKLQKILPRPVLMTIYKAFVRPHLDCGDVIYDEVYNQTFHQKLACLALSGAIRGSSR